jgi:hypothetical protein
LLLVKRPYEPQVRRFDPRSRQPRNLAHRAGTKGDSCDDAHCAVLDALRLSAKDLFNGRARISARHSKQSAKQTAETLYEAAQQAEDAGQEPTYCTAEAAKNSHLRLLFRTPAVPIPGTSNRTPADAPVTWPMPGERWLTDIEVHEVPTG